MIDPTDLHPILCVPCKARGCEKCQQTGIYHIALLGASPEDVLAVQVATATLLKSMP